MRDGIAPILTVLDDCGLVPQGIPVRARIVRATGDELTDIHAVELTRRLVLVQLDDRRLQLRGVWLAAADVRRRPGKTPASPT